MTYNCYVVLTTECGYCFTFAEYCKNTQYPRGPSYGIQCHPNVYAYYMSAIIGLF